MKGLALTILLLAPAAWAASDGAWTMTFRYPPQPVMLPSRCSTTCLRRQPDPWADDKTEELAKARAARHAHDHAGQKQGRAPQPPNPNPRPDGPPFVSGTPGKPASDDFQEWRKSDPGVLKKRAQEQREQANEVLRNALDGVTRPNPKPREPEEDE